MMEDRTCSAQTYGDRGDGFTEQGDVEDEQLRALVDERGEEADGLRALVDESMADGLSTGEGLSAASPGPLRCRVLM